MIRSVMRSVFVAYPILEVACFAAAASAIEGCALFMSTCNTNIFIYVTYILYICIYYIYIYIFIYIYIYILILALTIMSVYCVSHSRSGLLSGRSFSR